jgi:hypothetical protein
MFFVYLSFRRLFMWLKLTASLFLDVLWGTPRVGISWVSEIDLWRRFRFVRKLALKVQCKLLKVDNWYNTFSVVKVISNIPQTFISNRFRTSKSFFRTLLSSNIILVPSFSIAFKLMGQSRDLTIQICLPRLEECER